MAKKNIIEPESVDVTLDTSIEEEVRTFVPSTPVETKSYNAEVREHSNETINCLRNEVVIVRHIDKDFMGITNPKHVLKGGMSINAKKKYSVPKLTSGVYVNVLTNNEKNCLEEALGLEKNALSVHLRVNNFWDDSNGNGISQVELGKENNYFHLDNPVEYIKYKILLANKNAICPSLQEWVDHPKATYQFVIINEGDEFKTAKQNMTNNQLCLKEYGKVEEDADTLRLIIESITGRPVSVGTKIDWLQTKAFELIQADSKTFLSIITDEYLKYKVLIKKSQEIGAILSKGNQWYLKEGNVPLCEYGQEPTLNMAAKYLANPKHQDVLFALQANLK